MTEKEVKEYVKHQLGYSTVNVEITDKDYRVLMEMAMDKLRPYYCGVRYVQASGERIDVSNHDPIAVTKVWNSSNIAYSEVQDFMFGGVGLMVWDSTFMQRFESYTAYRMLWNELQYQKGSSFKLINKVIYLDGYMDSALIEMTVNIKAVEDIEDASMYSSWFKEYVLALSKELLGRKRGKATLEGSPIQLDANSLLAESQAEKANLESQLIGEVYIY